MRLVLRCESGGSRYGQDSEGNWWANYYYRRHRWVRYRGLRFRPWPNPLREDEWIEERAA